MDWKNMTRDVYEGVFGAIDENFVTIAYNNMCDYYSYGECDFCPIMKEAYDRCRGESCNEYIKRNTLKCIHLIRYWADDHMPTRQAVFLKKYPEAKVKNGVLNICPENITGECHSKNCDECKKKFWLDYEGNWANKTDKKIPFENLK